MNRTDLLNHLAEKHNLQRFLEIGTQNPDQNFNKVKCPYRISVDPDVNAHATFCMTSDDFFSQYNYKLRSWAISLGDPKFDLIFIDGLHTAEQVKKDFENALKILSPNGFIVLHDCNPLKEEHTIVPRPTKTGHWNGDVYKFACELVNLHSEKLYTVDIDNGCGVWSNSAIVDRPCVSYPWEPFESFNAFRKDLLNLISWEEFINL